MYQFKNIFQVSISKDEVLSLLPFPFFNDDFSCSISCFPAYKSYASIYILSTSDSTYLLHPYTLPTIEKLHLDLCFVETENIQIMSSSHS